MESIQQLAAEGRIIRNKWSDTDESGRQLLCLYTALAGDPEARPDTCPADLCPGWLAYLLPWMEESGTEAAWPSVVSRVGALAPRLGEIQGEASDQLRSRCLAHIVREAMRHTDEVEECMALLALLAKHGLGGAVAMWEWNATDAAARAATRNAASSTVRTAVWAVTTAGAFESVETTARVAVRAAVWDVSGVASETVATTEAADRITDAILTEIENFFKIT